MGASSNPKDPPPPPKKKKKKMPDVVLWSRSHRMHVNSSHLRAGCLGRLLYSSAPAPSPYSSSSGSYLLFPQESCPILDGMMAVCMPGDAPLIHLAFVPAEPWPVSGLFLGRCRAPTHSRNISGDYPNPCKFPGNLFQPSRLWIHLD